MLNTEYTRLLSFLIGSSGYLVPRPVSENVKISKTMHPYLLGKQNIHYFYNLEKSLYGIRAALEVLKNIIGEGGEVLLIGDSAALHSIYKKEPNINCLRWKRGALSKMKNVDLVVLNNISKENLVETHRKKMLLVGVGGSTTSKMSYPFNVNVESILLSHWFFSIIYTVCGQGIRLKKSKNKPVFSSLLGRGSPKVGLKGIKALVSKKGNRTKR
uniref:Ribosomal protein S2 n=1 Tax=Analipus japonicus TaxID=31333 RepID=A0A8F0FD30_9PHAE|nr:ribosomal protein S2 [Analipus japonicus]